MSDTLSWLKKIASIGANLGGGGSLQAQGPGPSGTPGRPNAPAVFIAGEERYPVLQCFAELRDAVAAIEKAAGRSRRVVFGAHLAPEELAPGDIVYTLENVPVQVPLSSFAGHELWDFSTRNVEKWNGRKGEHPPVSYVPVGYHPSMERFTPKPWEERDIDVVFSGFLSTRRAELLNELQARGLNVVHVPYPTFGAERDAYLARAKLALNFMYDGGWIYPVMRAAHCVANRVPVLSEAGPEMPAWVGPSCAFEKLADRCEKLVRGHRGTLVDVAEWSYAAFKKRPLVLPEPRAVEASPFTDPRWGMLRTGKPYTAEDLGAMYDAARGAPVSSTPLVAVTVPGYRESEHVAQICRLSRNAARAALHEAGIDSMVWPISGDSLVCRMRQRAVHGFLMTSATHMLFWDLDIECVTPECVAPMVRSGHGVIAGACPFKNDSGRTVHNLVPGEPPVVDADSCVRVLDAGTGFMLISRDALLRIMAAHPELQHWSMSLSDDRGAPLWAVFDTAIVDGVYQSEDYFFCHLWQKLGGEVYVYADARFKHWGEFGFEGSFREQHGLAERAA